MRLVLLGPPGAGKGTVANVLCQKFKILHVSTGDLLREAVKNNTSIGVAAKFFMDRGELVPDKTVTQMIIEKLKNENVHAGFALDGFPRTKNQAELLDNALELLKLPLGMVIYFETKEETILKRLSGRRICRNCGKIFHVVNIPPQKEGICDYCGKELYQREDDKVDTVKKRIEVYNQQTKELIDYYQEKKLLKKVSGDLKVDALFTVLEKIFRETGLI